MDSLLKMLESKSPMLAATAAAAGGYLAYRVLSRIHYNYGRIDVRY